MTSLRVFSCFGHKRDLADWIDHESIDNETVFSQWRSPTLGLYTENPPPFSKID